MQQCISGILIVGLNFGVKSHQSINLRGCRMINEVVGGERFATRSCIYLFILSFYSLLVVKSYLSETMWEVIERKYLLD